MLIIQSTAEDVMIWAAGLSLSWPLGTSFFDVLLPTEENNRTSAASDLESNMTSVIGETVVLMGRSMRSSMLAWCPTDQMVIRALLYKCSTALL